MEPYQIFSILHLIIAIISCVASVLLRISIAASDDLKTFVYANVLMAVAILYLVVGLSTWMTERSEDEDRWEVLLFLLSILWTLTVILLAMQVLVFSRYTGDKILGYFEPNIYNDSELTMIRAGSYMGLVTTVAVLLCNIAMTAIIVYFNFNKNHQF